MKTGNESMYEWREVEKWLHSPNEPLYDLKDALSALKEAWGGNPRPEITSSFLLGVAEGLMLCRNHSPEEIMEQVAKENLKANSKPKTLKWYERFFIRA